MKKQIISIIAASAMLGVPCLNAGLADWISENLPQSWQVSTEYRDEVKYIQEKTGEGNIPIIFKNSNDETSVKNFGIGDYRFAIMSINQGSFISRPPAYNTFTLAKATANVDKNHGGVHNTVFLAITAAMVPCMLSRLNKRSLLPLALGYLATTEALNHTFNGHEYAKEADAESFKKLAKLGYCKALHSEHTHYNAPEYITRLQDACKQCGSGINPAERPDSHTLMRNGIPQQSQTNVPFWGLGWLRK